MSSPLLAQETQIDYGAVQIGGASASTDYHIDGHYTLEQSDAAGAVSFEVVLSESVEATFQTKRDALEDELRKLNQRLTIKLNSTTMYDWDPADGANTGLLTRPSVRLLDGSTTHARWECRVEFTLPADSDSGRRNARTQVRRLDSGRRFVTLTGEYTALTANESIAQHDSDIGTFATAQLAIVDGSVTWALQEGSQLDFDEWDKVVSFSRTYEELVYGEGVGTTDDSDITNQELTISVNLIADVQGVSDLAANLPRQITALYSAAVSTSNTSLKAKWDTVIEPHIRTSMSAYAGGGVLTITESAPDFDPPNNRIRARMIGKIYSGSSLIAATEDIRTQRDYGKFFVPLADGNAYSYAKYQGPQTEVRTVTRRSLSLAGASQGGGSVTVNHNPLFQGGKLILGLPSGGGRREGGSEAVTSIGAPSGFEVIDEDLIRREFHEGIQGHRVELEFRSERATMQRVTVNRGGKQ